MDLQGENMDRKYNVDEINLQITNVDFWHGSKLHINRGGMRIYWNANIGCGTLDIVKRSGNDGDDFESPEEEFILTADTECMDSEDNKNFTRKILSLLADFVKIEG